MRRPVPQGHGHCHAFADFHARRREGLTLVHRRGMLKAGLAATIYQHMGVPLDATYEDDRGRPHPIVQHGGQPIRELLG